MPSDLGTPRLRLDSISLQSSQLTLSDVLVRRFSGHRAVAVGALALLGLGSWLCYQVCVAFVWWSR